MFKIDNKDTRTVSLTSIKNVKHILDPFLVVSIVDFEHVNIYRNIDINFAEHLDRGYWATFRNDFFLVMFFGSRAQQVLYKYLKESKIHSNTYSN